MFFDTLASIVERHLPQFVEPMKRARIFRLEREPAKSAGEAVDTWHPDEQTIENFRLPFDTVAIEYAPSRNAASDYCVVLSQFGPVADRQFRFLAGVQSERSCYVATGVLTALPRGVTANTYGDIVTFHEMRLWNGTKKSGLERCECRLEWIDQDYDKMSRLKEGTDFEQMMYRHAAGNLSVAEIKSAIETSTAKLGDLRREIGRLETNTMGGRCAVAVLGVLCINEPATFIVEERPVAPVRTPPTDIRRSAGREHYIVLKPRQIRERFIWTDGREPDEPDDELCKVTPHERRGHFRRYHSERYRNARGQVVWIKPMWIGPSEAVKGGNRYKVRLDL